MEEVVSLRLKLSEQEAVLQETRDRLRTSDLSRDSMELLIVSQRESSGSVQSQNRVRWVPVHSGGLCKTSNSCLSPVTRTRDVLKKAKTNLQVSPALFTAWWFHGSVVGSGVKPVPTSSSV